ncbi:endospore germination permease [Cohnella sp.]|uniref:GerAB/ArcD/ProY family transporter n=1 Tax=Cohnella sp. TaxID=1883426 RepID=UPI003564E448
MNVTTKHSITTLQFTLLIHGTQLGVGMLQIPRILAEQAGTDAWLSIIMNWIVSTAIGLLIIQIMKINPDRTMPDLFKHYFGKIFGALLTLVFIVFFTLTAVVEILRGMLFVKVWLLPETPDYIILITFVIPGYMIIRKGIQVLGRYAEMMFFCSLWIPILYLLPLRDGSWLNLLPIPKDGFLPIIHAAIKNSYSFFGSEIAFLLYPMLIRKENASTAMIVGNSLTMLAYLLATLVCFIYFGPDAIMKYNEPSVSVLKTIEFRFIERLEILLFTAYLFTVFKTWMSFIWAASYSVGKVIGKAFMYRFLQISLFFVVLYSVVYSHSFYENDLMQLWLGRASIFLSYAFPLFLYLYTRIIIRIRKYR